MTILQPKFDAPKLENPLNWTDPIVWHDPTIKKDVIAKLYDTDNTNNITATNSGKFPVTSDIKVDGIYSPIIKLNNNVIDSGNIKNMQVSYKGFLPSLTLEIYDINRNIRFSDVPGMNNVITVVFCPSVDYVYKKISLSFYITDFSEYDDVLLYHAEYKCFPLLQEKLTSITFDGCEKCNAETEQDLPNTWEYLHSIALETGLGFASTNKCKEINDRLNRLVRNSSYRDFIETNIRYSGLDDDSIFDCWIDLYGYLVLINVAYVFKENITANNLSIKVVKGINPTNDNTPTQKIEEVHRTLTNFNATTTVNNLDIDWYKDIVDNSGVINSGTLQTFQTFNIVGAENASDNKIETEQVQVKENSIDGRHTDDYEVEVKQDVQINFNSYNTKKQEIIRDEFFKKYRAKQLLVKLKLPNFGLQRGTLINLALFEEDIEKKNKIIMSSSNLEGDNEDITPDSINSNIDISDYILDEGPQIPNFQRNGLYYIDSMEFKYNGNSEEISQYLYLIKKGQLSNITNKYTTPKINFK